jgi:type I restriction enzyme S subunit
VKPGWAIARLAEVAQFRPPVAEARQRLSGDSLVSFAPMEDLGIDRKFLIPVHQKPLRDVAGSYTYFADGDVLLAKITPCFENGKLGIAAGLKNGVGFGSSEYVVLRPGDGLSAEWLYYYLSRESFRVEGASQMAGAVGHRRVAKEFLEQHPIPVPPLDDQQRIVGVLDAAFAEIAQIHANTEHSLRHAREAFERLLDLAFTQHGLGWVKTPLAECLQLITYGFTNPMPTTAEGPYMITAKNVVGGRIDFTSARRTSREAFNELLTDKSRPLIGDVLLTKDGTLGRVAVVDRAETCINQSVALLRPNERMKPHFMRLLLSSSSYQRQMAEDAGGTTIKHIYITRVDKMGVVYPESVQEQESIITRLDSLTSETQRLVGTYEQKLAVLDALKQSLLHQAFNGAL